MRLFPETIYHPNEAGPPSIGQRPAGPQGTHQLAGEATGPLVQFAFPEKDPQLSYETSCILIVSVAATPKVESRLKRST